MKIDISLKEVKELLLYVFESDASSRLDTRKVLCDTLAGRAVAHWASHPVADPSKQPPSVMTTATTESAHDGGADIDIDKENALPADVLRLDKYESYARAEAAASSIIRNLLDFEAWLDGRLSGDDDATVERVRFHAEVSCDGRAITMRHLTEYRNAGSCKFPRDDGRIAKWELPPNDDALEDFEADVAIECVRWVCDALGIDAGEYPDKDREAGGAE